MNTAKPTSLRNYVSFTALLGAVLILFFVCPANATVFFDDDFEPPTNFGDWPEFNTTVSELAVTTQEKFTGSQSLRLIYTDPVNPCACGAPLGRTFPATTHLFLRFAYKTSVPFQVADIGLTKVLWITGYPGGWLELQDSPFGTNGKLLLMLYAYDRNDVERLYTNVFVADGQWHQIEAEFLLNTPGVSNGAVRVWIDNVLGVESLNRQLRGPTPTSVAPWGGKTPSDATLNRIEIYRQTGLGTTYYDRVSAGDTRIGVIGVDGAPHPSPPSSVTAK